MKYSEIIPIKIYRVTPPIDEAIEVLTHPYWTRAEADEFNGVTPAHIHAKNIQIAHICHWVIKLKYDSRHPMPKMPRGFRDAYKPLGVIYTAALELCLQMPALALENGYRHSGVLWGKVMTEHALSGVGGTKKTEAIAELQKQNKKLANYENPFNRQEHPATWLVVERSSRFAEKNDIFHKQYWRPFVKARQDYATALRSPKYRKVFDEGEDFVMRLPGNNNKTEKIPPMNLSNPQNPSQ